MAVTDNVTPRNGGRMRPGAAAALVLAGAVLSCGCANRLFYFPTTVAYRTPQALGTPAEEVRFASGDGTRLAGWFLPAHGAAHGTIVHLHGNAQNMTAHVSYVDWLPARGFNVLVFDYRGYGASEGRPTREGTLDDTLAALRYAAARPDVDPGRLVLLGQSLGGALAIAVAGSGQAPPLRAVVAESAFHSYRGIVRDKIGGMGILRPLRVPLSWMVSGNARSPDAVVDRIAPVPLLLIHGTADQVIPYAHAQKLYELAREPKTLWTVEGGRHTEALARPELGYRDRLVDFLVGVLDAPTADAADLIHPRYKAAGVPPG